MTLEELKNWLLINSNQYFVGENDIEVDDNVLQGLVDRALIDYGKYRPYRWYGKVALSNDRKLDVLDNREILNIDKIFMFDPVYGYTEYPFKWHWDPVSKTFKSMGGGVYYVKASLLPTLEDINRSDYQFLDLVLANYLMYIGNVRSSFKIEGMTIDNNGEELYNRGQELREKTLEQLAESGQHWWQVVEDDFM